MPSHSRNRCPDCNEQISYGAKRCRRCAQNGKIADPSPEEIAELAAEIKAQNLARDRRTETKAHYGYRETRVYHLSTE